MTGEASSNQAPTTAPGAVASAVSRPSVLVVGPTPPPTNGMSIATDVLMHSAVVGAFDVELVDISDRRGLGNVGKFDLGNVFAALGAGLRFLRALLRMHPDVVYTPVAQGALGFIRDSLFLLPSRSAGVPVVIHVHGSTFGTFYSRAGSVMRRVIHASICKATAVIVLGEGLRPMMDGLVPDDRVHVVPNGIEDHAGGPIERARPGAVPKVLFMSTAKASKGVLDLMRACGSLHEAGCAAEYVIAGEWTDPADRSAAERLIADFGMESAVTLLGDVQPPEKWERLRDADIFVLPSWAEGQPYAILEAMCFGLPVVASAVGAIPETVGDGEQGLLIEPHDVEGMHAALEQLITDEDLRRRMGTAARRRYEADFTLKRWEADMTQVLRLAAPGETTT